MICKCKVCDKEFLYDDEHGYSRDVCGAFCDGMDARTATMLCDMPTIHKRKCHDCGNVAWHADNRTPYVCCQKCGSQDTRR